MKIPEDINTIMSEEIFLNYIFSKDHFMGIYKSSLLKEYQLDKDALGILIPQLKQFPQKYKVTSALPVQDNNTLFRFVITGQLHLNQKPPVLIHTLWIYKRNKEVEFINLIVGEA